MKQLDALLRKVTGAAPRMWGSSIVGYGTMHYTYATGHSGDWMLLGFSPRKQALTLYVMNGLAEAGALLARMGKHSIGKGCVYVKRLDDIDLGVLEQLLRHAVASQPPLTRG